MGATNLALFLLLVSILLSGCLSPEEKPEEFKMSEETGTSDAADAANETEISDGENEAEIATDTATKTKRLNNSENMSDVEELETSKKRLEILEPDESEPETYLVRRQLPPPVSLRLSC